MIKLAVNKFINESFVNNGGSINGNAYSVLDMLNQADLFVQIIMGILVLLSLVTWTIFFNRYYLFKKINREIKILSSFLSKNDFSFTTINNNNFSFIKKLNFFGDIFLSTYNITHQNHKSEKTVMMQNVEIVISEINTNCEENLFWLGTIASTAPFIGLLGTVWGIMNSFQSIALSKDTSLAVVAPGIAEALLATALGLVAAIPAVIAYNKLSNNLNTYALRLQNFASEFEALLSRHLSEQSTEE